MRVYVPTAILVFLLLACAVPIHAQDVPVSADVSINRVTLDFERLRDLEPVTNQFASFGVTFVGATVLGQGSSLNYLHFPPRSGVNVIYDDPVQSGRITVTFDPNVAQNVTLVGAYVTGDRNVTMTAYDAANSVLGSASTGGANFAPDGVPNKLLQINASQAIKTVVFFNGGECGNTYTVDDFFFEGGLTCRVNGVPLYKQGGTSVWADDLYGGSESQPWYDRPGHQALVRDWGCAMTSAAMVVSYYGSLQGKGTATPRELNNWLRRHSGYSGGLILWSKVAEFARTEKGIDLYYYEGWGPDNGIVNAYVCNSAPIILNTTSSPYTSGHYVVGTGVSDSTAWTVNDPGGWNITTLRSDSYNSYRKYGSVRKEPKQLTIAIHPPNAPLIASAGANAPVSILVTDPAGRRLRYDAISGSFENQILDANFAMEKLGAQDGSGRSIEAYVFGTGAPLDGEYQVQITSHVAGSYQLDLLGYDSGGQSSSVSLAGYAPSGGEIDLGVGYSSTPGSSLDVTTEWPQRQIYLPLVLNRQANAAQFIGSWRNEDANTGGITRTQIRRESNALFVHMWGACHPTDCDWDEISTSVSDADDRVLSLTWTFSFAVVTQQVNVLPDGRLRVIDHTHFTDNSGRSDYDTLYLFVRE